ncbi:MAG: hypothetical protein ACI8TP_002829 [Acidimicrobiales bacterium]|jgi:hypothetical protein
MLGVAATSSPSAAEEFEAMPGAADAHRAAQGFPGLDTGCPEMDHSIVRLYVAYFLRVPDVGGYDGWRLKYMSGEWSLTRISEFFSVSPEFVSRYGAKTDAEFVTLLYNNVLFRDPDEGGLAHWTGQLAAGVRRGTVMLAFSESQEYVDVATETNTPMAGYGRWYPGGVVWTCGSGNESFNLNRSFAYADVLIRNTATVDQAYEIDATDASGTLIKGWRGDVETEFIRWEFDNDASLWTRFEIRTANNVFSTLVLYDAPPPLPRNGDW